MALASPAYVNGTHFFLFAVVITFIGVVLWSFAYFLGIKDVLNLPINWTLSVSHAFEKLNSRIFIGNLFFLGICKLCDCNNSVIPWIHYSNFNMDRIRFSRTNKEYRCWNIRSF